MNLRDKINSFNKRWNITTSQEYEEEFRRFKIRIINLLREVDSIVPKDEIIKFCNLVGKVAEWKYTSQDEYSLNIIETFINESDEKEFYRLIEILFLLQFKSTNSIKHKFDSFRNHYYDLIKEVIDYSNVNVTILRNGNDIILYPRGEELLDEKIVNEVLLFLTPNSRTHFIEAMKFYEGSKGVKSAESLRRTLEEFLRKKLNNKKGLDNNILELGKNLKATGIATEIRNVVFQVLDYMDKYFNENSKHKDGQINEAENEYLIYQTGLLLRYINKVI